MKIIGYAYEADYHCVSCTELRFNTKDLDPIIPILDNEGNEIHPMFSSDEYGYEGEDMEGVTQWFSPCCRDCYEELQDEVA